MKKNRSSRNSVKTAFRKWNDILREFFLKSKTRLTRFHYYFRDYTLIGLAVLSLTIGVLIHNRLVRSSVLVVREPSADPLIYIYYPRVVSNLTSNILWVQVDTTENKFSDTIEITFNSRNTFFLNDINVITIQPESEKLQSYAIQYVPLYPGDNMFHVSVNYGAERKFYGIKIKDGTLLLSLKDSLFLCSFIWAYLAVFKKEMITFQNLIGVPIISCASIIIILLASTPIKEIILQLLSS